MLQNTINLSPISWRNFLYAIDWYEKICNFQMIEVPWIIPTEVSQLTFDGQPYEVGNCQSLIGSAEQAFLYLADLGHLPIGNAFMALTPCFRNEKDMKKLTQKHFMKLELWQSADRPLHEEDAWDLAKDAYDVFYNLKGKADEQQVVRTEQGFDININGIEVGSYGIRSAVLRGKEIWWAYGTGLAEPRFSGAVRK